MSPGTSKPEGPPATMTRREFKIALGAAAGSAILGYLLLPQAPGTQPASLSPGACPRLRHGLAMEGPAADGMTVVRLPDGGLCAVNAAGAAVLRRLDGAHSIEQIARAAAARAGVAPDAPLIAKMACFVAQLGAAGFLDAPFYAQIVARMEA
jgi:hypothetical protein